jgi:cytochrome o ubiquinol oxidase operon protein cyoD
MNNAHNNVDTRTYFEDIGAWPAHKGSLLYPYIVGFVLSILLTFAAYGFASPHVQAWQVYTWLGVLALLQFVVQLVCFLHLSGKGSRDRVLTLLATILMVIVLAGGSLWVMFNLNSRMTSSQQEMVHYMDDQDGGI